MEKSTIVKILFAVVVIAIPVFMYFIYKGILPFLGDDTGDSGSDTITTTTRPATYTTTRTLEKEYEPLVPLMYPNNHWDHMPLTVFIDIDSGRKFPTFDRTTELKNARNAMAAWQRKTNETVRFTEVGTEEDADIVVKWTNATYQTPGETWKTMGTTYSSFLPNNDEYIITHAEIHLTLSAIDCHNAITPMHEFGHALGLAHATYPIVREENLESYDIMWTGGPCSGVVTTDEALTLMQFYEDI